MEGTSVSESNGKQSAGNGQRDQRGRFAKGNPGGPGRPAGRVAVEAWRAAFAQAVEPDDIRAVAQTLVEAARAGERWAITELLDRCVGQPSEVDVEERLVELERLVEERITQ